MRTLVTAKINPDLDGTSCIYAYTRLLTHQGTDVVGKVQGTPHPEALYLLDRFDIAPLPQLEPDEVYARIVIVDASEMIGMPDVIRTDKVVEVIDHRFIGDPSLLFPNARVQVEKVGAAATLIVERLRAASLPLDAEAAVLLYGAIHSNTLTLQSVLTSPRDLDAAQWLEQHFGFDESLIIDMFRHKTHILCRDFTHYFETELKTFTIGQHKVGIIQFEIIDGPGLVSRYRDVIDTRLLELKASHRFDSILFSIVALDHKHNYLITSDAESESFFHEHLDVSFRDGVAETGRMWLRKELVPKLIKSVGT